MKLTLQITLGVFLGILLSQLVIDGWHDHKEQKAKSVQEKQLAEREKKRQEQGELIRKLLLQNRQIKPPNSSEPPADFVPDDAEKP